MPVAAPRPCRKPGCPRLSRAPHGYCEGHTHIAQAKAEEAKRKRWASDKRGSAHSRGYDANWQRVRKAKLSAVRGLCEECGREGKLRPAKVVHHKDEDQHNNAQDNLEALCWMHHEMRHGRLKGDRGVQNPGGVRPRPDVAPKF